MSKRLEFTTKTKKARWAHCKGLCEAEIDGTICGEVLVKGKIEYHHYVECEYGGDNSFENCRTVSKACHVILTSRFVGAIRKADRMHAIQINAKAISPRGFPKVAKPPRISRHPKLSPPRIYEDIR